jgi:hypothetical protein
MELVLSSFLRLAVRKSAPQRSSFHARVPGCDWLRQGMDAWVSAAVPLATVRSSAIFHLADYFYDTHTPFSLPSHDCVYEVQARLAQPLEQHPAARRQSFHTDIKHEPRCTLASNVPGYGEGRADFNTHHPLAIHPLPPPTPLHRHPVRLDSARHRHWIRIPTDAGLATELRLPAADPRGSGQPDLEPILPA